MARLKRFLVPDRRKIWGAKSSELRRGVHQTPNRSTWSGSGSLRLGWANWMTRLVILPGAPSSLVVRNMIVISEICAPPSAPQMTAPTLPSPNPPRLDDMDHSLLHQLHAIGSCPPHPTAPVEVQRCANTGVLRQHQPREQTVENSPPRRRWNIPRPRPLSVNLQGRKRAVTIRMGLASKPKGCR